MEVEQPTYVESYDAVVDKLYAFVAFKETGTGTGKCVVRIKSAVTAGTAFDPDNASLKNALRKAAAHGEGCLVWGFNLRPSENDPRLVENRVLFDEGGNHTSVEMHLVKRKADGSAQQEQVAAFDWPH